MHSVLVEDHLRGQIPCDVVAAINVKQLYVQPIQLAKAFVFERRIDLIVGLRTVLVEAIVCTLWGEHRSIPDVSRELVLMR